MDGVVAVEGAEGERVANSGVEEVIRADLVLRQRRKRQQRRDNDGCG